MKKNNEQLKMFPDPPKVQPKAKAGRACMNKVCSRCHVVKPIDEFPTRTDRKNRRGICNLCLLARQREYNKEKKVQVAFWRAARKKVIPWFCHYRSAYSRCNNPKSTGYPRYGGRGIQCLMSPDDFKFLWFRDKASKMLRPEIHRDDADESYTIKNCFFMPRSDHRKLHNALRFGEKAPSGARVHIEEDKYSKDYCFNYLRESEWLWDLRAWLAYKDKKEVDDFVSWITSGKGCDRLAKNDGHAIFCIQRLRELGAKRDEITAAIMANPKVKYARRTTPCFYATCKKRKQDEGSCKACEGEKITDPEKLRWTYPSEEKTEKTGG